jgi:hypothetical protein
MQFSQSAWRRLAFAAAATLCALTQAACNRTPNTSIIGTFRMGEKVQIGPTIYNVLESEWKPALTEGGRAPRNRFLFINLSVTNSGGTAVPVPSFELQATDGTRYQEVSQNMEGVRDWLGLLRNVQPAGTQRGVVVFDVPIAAYKLIVPDGSDISEEKYALVEIPVQLE